MTNSEAHVRNRPGFQAMGMPKRSLWPEVALCLLYWGDRLHNLLSYPAFIDETIHIRWAKMVWYLIPFDGANDGRISNILLYAMFWPFGPANLWAARTASLLVGLAGFAGLVKVGEMLFGRRAGRLAGGIFILLPFAFFFERMAMADTLGIPLLTITMLSSLAAVVRLDRRWGIVGGLALAGLILAKLNDLIYVVVPLLTLVLFLPRRADRRRAIRQVTWLYLVAGLIVGPILYYLIFNQHSTLGFINAANRVQPVPLPNRLAANGRAFISFLGPYITWPVATLTFASLLLGLLNRFRETLWVSLTAVLVLLLFGVGTNSFESRYIVTVLPGTALLGGYGASWLVSKFRRIHLPAIVPSVFLPVLVLAPLAFHLRGWYRSEQLPLPSQLDFIHSQRQGKLRQISTKRIAHAYPAQ